MKKHQHVLHIVLTGTLLQFASCASWAGEENRSQTEQSWLKSVQQAPENAPTPKRELSNLLTDDNGRPISTLPSWKEKRDQITKAWEKIVKPLPISRDTVPTVEVIEEDRIGDVIRQRIRYDVEPGIPTEAYLLKPVKIEGQLPGVVVFHSTVNHSIRQPAGIEGKPEKFYGLKLAQRGYVTLCPRNYLWPTNDKIEAKQEADRFHARMPHSTGMAKMLYDALVAVDLLVSLPEVDKRHIGAVGHSLGAKEVLYLAAFDERVKATVSSEGGISTTFSNWDAPWYLGSQINEDSFSRDHHELLALIAPRPFLLIGGDSADGDQSWPYIDAALDVYRLYGGPSRIGLLNHKQGHAVPPISEKWTYDWLDVYLKGSPPPQ